MIAVQFSMVKAGAPASVVVITSGMKGLRDALAIASARSFPLLT